MKSYYRLMLGEKSKHAAECLSGGFVGTDFHIHQDLSSHLPDNWREFNKAFIPVFLEIHPGKSKVAAGLACAAIWVVSKGMLKGDVILCPDGTGSYQLGEIDGAYCYAADQILQHRRTVKWLGVSIRREDLSQELKSSTGASGTVVNISDYANEIELILSGSAPPTITTTDDTIEDPSTFAMEKHLEEFLVSNWSQTELGKEYTIYTDEGQIVGQQYPTDTGPIDILAIGKDGTKLLVVELKRGRASDVVVGQILRYMGYVKDELAEPHQSVQGVIIALEDDPKLKRAISMVPSIEFYRYAVSFKLIKGS